MKLEDMKRVAGAVSQAYMLHGISMTKSVYDIAKKQNLNPEQIRRICEIANQNTYLELFQDKEKRGNIDFDTAKSEDIIKSVEEHKVEENDYAFAPTDFRKTANLKQEDNDDVTTSTPETTKEKSGTELAVEDKKKAMLKDNLGHFRRGVTTMKHDEAAAVEDAVDKIAEFCLRACADGDSFADISKLAMRHTHSKGLELNHTVAMLGKVAEFVRGRGVIPSAELTKTSSMNIDPRFSLFQMIDEFDGAVTKHAALSDMEKNVSLFLDVFEKDR